MKLIILILVFGSWACLAANLLSREEKKEIRKELIGEHGRDALSKEEKKEVKRKIVEDAKYKRISKEEVKQRFEDKIKSKVVTKKVDKRPITQVNQPRPQEKKSFQEPDYITAIKNATPMKSTNNHHIKWALERLEGKGYSQQKAVEVINKDPDYGFAKEWASAVVSGDMLDPMPKGWVNVRTVVSEANAYAYYPDILSKVKIKETKMNNMFEDFMPEKYKADVLVQLKLAKEVIRVSREKSRAIKNKLNKSPLFHIDKQFSYKKAGRSYKLPQWVEDWIEEHPEEYEKELKILNN